MQPEEYMGTINNRHTAYMEYIHAYLLSTLNAGTETQLGGRVQREGFWRGIESNALTVVTSHTSHTCGTSLHNSSPPLPIAEHLHHQYQQLRASTN
jgi:hypothetical protein